MKIRNRTFKIITLLTLSILMIAIMAIFPLVNNVSAEEEINTTDEYLTLQPGFNIANTQIFVVYDIINSLYEPTETEKSGYIKLYDDDYIINLQFYYTITMTGPDTYEASYTLKLFSSDDGILDIIIDSNQAIMPDNFMFEYDLPSTVIIDNNNISFLKVLNPDYIPPVEEPEPTEEPENPINEITDFFSNASVAAIILLVLGAFVVYSIIKK